jgi:mannose-1-phosphate guanylyltransferase/mannose-6-phosphate isomerase
MRLVDDHTLLQCTLLRLAELEHVEAPIIICNEAHRFIVAEQLREIGVSPDAIVLEPVGRNTAPAITVAALMATQAQQDPALLVLPADHFIQDTAGFAETVMQGVRFAEQKKLVTFGIVPDVPETGYGYIRKGKMLISEGDSESPSVWKIDEFVEKPNLETAESYLASGSYCWNSGMFVFKAGRFLDELNANEPSIINACRKAISEGLADLDFFRLNKPAFEACTSDSIDYAVMEKTRAGVIVALNSKWNDLGSWEALWQAGQKDSNENVISGDVCLENVQDCYVHAASRLVTAVGLSKHVIVETKDAVFVAPRDYVQQVKALVDQLKNRQRPETLTHKEAYRPWGRYEDMASADRFAIKRVTVNPRAKLSLQKHLHRAEHWVVVRGTALVTKGDEQFILKEDQSAYIPLGVVHRLENPGMIPLELVEIHSGSYLGEDDIVRLDDVYGRHNNK